MAPAVACLFAIIISGAAPSGESRSKLVYPGADGELRYTPDENGNTIPDFSNCGYRGGGVAIPSDVSVKATVEFRVESSQDDTKRIQDAIDQISKLPPDKNGIRGAVLIKRGTYHIAKNLRMIAGGVVLRGEGEGEDGTVLVATGKEQRSVIQVKGSAAPREQGAKQKITDAYVPVGARGFTVDSASGLKVGDRVFVRRAGNSAWIHFIGMDRILERPGHPGSTKQWQAFELPFDRVITAISGNKVTVDAPIVCAIEQKWGGGTVQKYEDAGRIEQVGVENLRGDSEYDKSRTEKQDGQAYPSDENHATYLLAFDDAKNCWAKNLTAVHFYNGVSSIGRDAKWVTVQDCTSLEPVSVITGGRRYPFQITGQLNLVQRCRSDKDRHAFVFGSRVCGPNVFLDCVSTHAYATSEPHHRWSVGGLYDNVHAHMAFQDRQWMGSGHGWAGANYVAWNCEGELVCQRPPTAQNWAIGFVGKKNEGAFAPRPDGYWESLGRHVTPRSLYLKQLEDRLGPSAVAAIGNLK